MIYEFPLPSCLLSVIMQSRVNTGILGSSGQREFSRGAQPGEGDSAFPGRADSWYGAAEPQCAVQTSWAGGLGGGSGK